jgi:hypothetical protein
LASNDTIYKLGLITQAKKDQTALQVKVRSYRESINLLFFKHPFELHKIDTDAVRNLANEMIACIERYKHLQAQIEELEG